MARASNQNKITLPANLVELVESTLHTKIENLSDKEICDTLVTIYSSIVEFFTSVQQEFNDVDVNNLSVVKMSGDDQAQYNESDAIKFSIIKEKGTYHDYECPYCGEKNKILIDRYVPTSFYDYTCPKCHSTSLTRLRFTLVIESYIKKGVYN